MKSKNVKRLLISKDTGLQKPWEKFLINPYCLKVKLKNNPNDPYSKRIVGSRKSRLSKIFAGLPVSLRLKTRMAEGGIEPGALLTGAWGLRSLLDTDFPDEFFTGYIPRISSSPYIKISTHDGKKSYSVEAALPGRVFPGVFEVLPRMWQLRYVYYGKNDGSGKDTHGEAVLTRPVDVHSVFTRIIPFVSQMAYMRKFFRKQLFIEEVEEFIDKRSGRSRVVRGTRRPLWRLQSRRIPPLGREGFGQLETFCLYADKVFYKAMDSAAMMLVPILGEAEQMSGSGSRMFALLKDRPLETLCEYQPEHLGTWLDLLVTIVSWPEGAFSSLLTLLITYVEIYSALENRHIEDSHEIQELLLPVSVFMENLLGFLQMLHIMLFKGTYMEGAAAGALWNMDSRTQDGMEKGMLYREDAALAIQHWILHDDDITFDELSGRKDYRIPVTIPKEVAVAARKLYPDTDTAGWGLVDLYLEKFFSMRDKYPLTKRYSLDQAELRAALYIGLIFSEIPGIRTWIKTGVPERYGGKSYKGRSVIDVMQLGMRQERSCMFKEFEF